MLQNYLIIALRNFKNQGLYSVINVLGLSVGMASAMIILLYVHNELSADKHHEHYDGLYRIGIEIGIGGPPVTAALSPYPAGPDMMENFPEITNYARLYPVDFLNSDILIEYDNQRLYEKGVMLTDSGFFELFTHPVVYGDPSSALRVNDKAVLTRSTAERIFGSGDPVGKSFRINGTHNVEVGAVIEDIPDNSHLKFRILLYWHSLDNITSRVASDQYFNNNVYTYLKAGQRPLSSETIAKLDEYVEERSIRQLEGTNIEASYRMFFRPMKELYFFKDEAYQPLNTETIPNKGDRLFVYIFITIAVFLTTIASINYMNISIARSVKRSKEVGVRKVMGADKGSLIRQFLAEAFFISLIALLLALFLVEISLPFFNELLMKSLRFHTLLRPVFSISILLLVLFTTLLSGSYPAFYLSGFRPIEVLKQKLKLSGSNLILRKILLGLQFTISVFMIIATMVVLQQLSFIRNKELGYQKDNVLIINISALEEEGRISLKKELEQLSMVSSASLSSNIPGPGSSLQHWGLDAETKEGYGERMSAIYQVDHSFAKLYDLQIKEGRFFDSEQATDMTQSILINESAARLFEWDNPIGKRFRFDGNQEAETRTVIGVVKDFHTESLLQEVAPLVIFPQESGNRLSLRLSPGNVSNAMTVIEDKWKKFSGGIPLRHQFLDERHKLTYISYENLGRLFTLFAILCIFLSLMGLFGLAGFSAEQKTKEIGIRKVHGASGTNILHLLYREYIWLMILAIVIASAFSWLLMDNWLSQFAFRIDIGIIPFLFATVLSFFVSIATVGFHAMKSSGANPVEALKYE